MADETKTAPQAESEAQASDFEHPYIARVERTIKRLQKDFPDGHHIVIAWGRDEAYPGKNFQLVCNNSGSDNPGDFLFDAANTDEELSKGLIEATFAYLEKNCPPLWKAIDHAIKEYNAKRKREEQRAAKTEYLSRKRH